METTELCLTLSAADDLQREFEQNLRHGRAFVQDADALPVLSDCVLVITLGSAVLRLTAQVVMVSDSGPHRGVGVELRPFDASVHSELADFVATTGPGSADGDAATEPTASEESNTHQGDTRQNCEAAPEENQAATEDEVGTEVGPEDHKGGRPTQVEPRHVQLRKLSFSQQQNVARTGDLSDRVAVERLYGKAVWSALLQNPKLTVPEVAKLARKGTVPRPLLEVILENRSWLKSAPVRRALMSNPRTSQEGVLKLLRMTPKHELRTIHKGTSYSPNIREQARKLLE